MNCSVCEDGSHEDLRLLLLDIQRMHIRVTNTAAAEYLGDSYTAQNIMSGHVQDSLHLRVVTTEEEPGAAFGRAHHAKGPTKDPLIADSKELRRQVVRLNSL